MNHLVYLSIILLGLHVSTANKVNYDLFVPLVKRLHILYSSSAVIFTYPATVPDTIDALGLKRVIHSWSRLLHRENIPTLIIGYDQIYKVEEYYQISIAPPLIVMLITNLQSYQEFLLITKTVKMYSAAWIVNFVPTAFNDTYDYCYHPSGNPFHLAFNTRMLVICYTDFLLREWYSVDGKSTEIFDLVRWEPGTDLDESFPFDMLMEPSLYRRRNNLKGVVLRGVSAKVSLVMTVKGKEVTGFLGEIIKQLENTLNFTIDLVAEEQDYGGFNITTKRWSGAMRLVAAGEVDIGVSDFTMTNTRLDYIDFTVPLLTTRLNLCMKEPEFFAVKWSTYYKGFSFSVWISVIVTMLLTQTVITFIRCSIESCLMQQTMRNEFIRIWGIFCLQGLPEFPRNSSLRIAYFAMFINGIVINSAFSAALTCLLTARMRYVPFRTIEELVQDGSYRFIVTRDSADYDTFAHSKDSLSVGIMKLMKPHNSLPLYVQTAYEDVCNDDRLVFYTGYGVEERKVTENLRVPCKISYLNFGRVDSQGMILTKDNQYTAVINYHLQHLLTTGVLIRSKADRNFEEAQPFQAVEIGSIMSGLIVFFCSAALSLIILIVELCYHKRKHTARASIACSIKTANYSVRLR